MSLEKTLRNKINKQQGTAVKNILAESLKNSGNPNLADIVNKSANWQDAISNLNVVTSSENLNSMVGDLFGFIAKQTIIEQTLNSENIFGWCFKESEEIQEGGGISIVEVVLNGAGTNQIVNYQTSTAPTGEIALGSSFSNSNQINYTIDALAFQNATFQTTNSNTATPFFITINKTVPVTWEQFSTLSAIKAQNLIEAYYNDVNNAIAIYKYNLGNILFGATISQNGTTFNNPFSVAKTIAPSTTYTNLYEYLQNFFLPQLLYMKQLTAQYNSFENGTELLQNASCFSLNGYNFNANGYNAPVLNNGMTEEMTIYMSPKTSAAILSVLNLPNFKDANSENLDIIAQHGIIKSICGIKVKLTGTVLSNTVQTAQGTAIQPNIGSGKQVFEDGQILVVSDEFLTFSKLYENIYTSDVWGNAMIKTVRAQLAYLPVCKPQRNGCLFTGLPLNLASLPVYNVPTSTKG